MRKKRKKERKEKKGKKQESVSKRLEWIVFDMKDGSQGNKRVF